MNHSMHNAQQEKSESTLNLTDDQEGSFLDFPIPGPKQPTEEAVSPGYHGKPIERLPNDDCILEKPWNRSINSKS